MISNPKLVYYACVARGATVLAEFNSKHADLGALARNCLDKAPPLHSVFSHTVRQRSYTFFLDGDFAYFAISDERLENSEKLAFLTSVKDAFGEVSGNVAGKKRLEHLSSHCFQGDFSPVFHRLLGSGDVEEMTSPTESGHARNVSSDSSVVCGPLLAVNSPNSNHLVKKKKKFPFGDCLANNVGGNVNRDRGLEGCENSEFRVVMSKNGSGIETGHMKAKKVWKKHVWVVLSMDLIICTILFVVWLSICRGFKCVDG